MSMQAYLKAVVRFLRGFGVPVYAAGHLPRRIACPYMTYTPAYAPFAQQASVTVTLWHRGENALADCAAQMDQLLSSIPEGGRILRYPGGVAILCRGQGNFVTSAPDAADPFAVAGVLRLTVRIYDHA